jgi:hypothetical protein
MVSDLISYAPLAVVFIVAGLRMITEKAGKDIEIAFLPSRKKLDHK